MSKMGFPFGDVEKELSNPPAYPSCTTVDGCKLGMTLRDWFAGQVIKTFIHAKPDYENYDREAGWAYKIADAMLVERAKEKK